MAVFISFFFFFSGYVVALLSVQFFLVASLLLKGVCTYLWVIMGKEAFPGHISVIYLVANMEQLPK